MAEKSIRDALAAALLKRPAAVAQLHGSALAPELSATVWFFPFLEGTLVAVQAKGLPDHVPAVLDRQPIGPFGFHIHEGGTCGIDMTNGAFKSAGEHYNPTKTYHPEHAGDLPVLFSNNGECVMAVYTNRFKPTDVVGRTVIIHQNPDDFRPQPSGNAGVRIACGVIEKA